MNSRERVEMALNHEEPDRVPIDFGAMRSTGVNAVAYGELKQYLGMDLGPTRVYDTWQQLADPDVQMQERFHADVVQLYRIQSNWGIWLDAYKEGTASDGSPVMIPACLNPIFEADGSRKIVDAQGNTIAVMPADGYYYENMVHPYEHVTSAAELVEKFSYPEISDRELDLLEARAKDLYENTDKAILGEFIGTFYEQGQADFNYENYYYNIAAEQEMIHVYNKKLLNAYLNNLERYLKRVGKYLNVIHFGDDLGMQNALQISVGMYREMIKPYAKELYQYVHENYPHIKCFLHSCGAIFPLIGDFIDAGIDVLNPVQLTAAGMDAVALKETFGNRISFWGGGVNTTTTATNGTAAEVDEEVKYLMNIFKKNGGFIWTQVHNIQCNVPVENIVSMYDAAYRYGAY